MLFPLFSRALSSLLSSNFLGHFSRPLSSNFALHPPHGRVHAKHTAARSLTLIDPSRGRITRRRRCHSPSRPLRAFPITLREEGDRRPGYTPLHVSRTYAHNSHVTITFDLEMESTQGQPTSCRAPVLAFEHTPPTRSQPPGVWRVMGYDSNSSSAVIQPVTT